MIAPINADVKPLAMVLPRANDARFSSWRLKAHGQTNNLRGGDGSRYSRCRSPVFQEQILGTAYGEYWHCLSLCSFLLQIFQPSMIAPIVAEVKPLGVGASNHKSNHGAPYKYLTPAPQAYRVALRAPLSRFSEILARDRARRCAGLALAARERHLCEVHRQGPERQAGRSRRWVKVKNR